MKYQLVSFFFVFCVILVNGDGETPKTAVKIVDCLDEGPCALHDGTVATFISDFVVPDSSKPVTNLRLEVFLALVMSRGVPYGLDEIQTQACHGVVGKQCPLQPGDKVRHILNLPIHRFGRNGTLTLLFKDDDLNLIGTFSEFIVFD